MLHHVHIMWHAVVPWYQHDGGHSMPVTSHTSYASEAFSSMRIRKLEKDEDSMPVHGAVTAVTDLQTQLSCAVCPMSLSLAPQTGEVTLVTVNM